MTQENVSQEFRLKNIDETGNYLIEETNCNGLTGMKHKRICTTINYIENFLIVVSTILCVLLFLLLLL